MDEEEKRTFDFPLPPPYTTDPNTITHQKTNPTKLSILKHSKQYNRNLNGSPQRNNVIKQRESQIKLITEMEHQKENEETALLLNQFEEMGVTKRKTSSSHLPNIDLIDLDETNNFESYVVIEFSKTINRNTLHWIIDKIRGKKAYGGAELLLVREPILKSSIESTDEGGLTIHVSATKIKLLELADEIGIMKQTKFGVMKNFNVVSLDDFYLNDNMSIDDLLTSADRQIIVKHALESIKAKENERCFPGSEITSLYHGESIIEAAIWNEMILRMYSLHDQEFLKKLGPDWYKKIFEQPVHRIREYFGESVGIYFAFAEFYTIALTIPTILGLLQCFLSYEAIPLFCIFNVVWMTVFTETWKRRCSVLSYKWGTISMTNLDMPRIGYYGKIGKDPITGKKTPLYPLFKTYVKMYLISWPVILFCLVGATYLTLSQFWIEDSLKESFGADSYILYIPSIVMSIIVALLSLLYEYLATWLTDLENHRTQIQYERHRVNKLIILEFVNNFLSLFYIAFVLKDIKMLKSQLLTQLIIVQAVQNLKETLYPLFKQKFFAFTDSLVHTNTMNRKNPEENFCASDIYDELNISKLQADDPKIQQNEIERDLDEYCSTYEDYLELYIQFGYVVLFSSVAPLAAFWAFLNNIFEIRVDAFKLCKMHKRPFAKRAKDTGAWLLAFQVLSLMSVVSNCGIVYLSPQVKQLNVNWTDAEWIIAIVFVEHIMFIVIWIIDRAIPDCPHWIRVALAKADFESKQALKRESAQNSKVLLFRRFKSVNDKSDKKL